MPLIVKTKIVIGGLSISNNDFTFLTIHEKLGSHHSIALQCPLPNIEKLGFSLLDIKKYVGVDMDIECEINGSSAYKYKGIVTSLKSVLAKGDYMDLRVCWHRKLPASLQLSINVLLILRLLSVG